MMNELLDMLTRKIDFKNRSMDFKVGYGYGFRDGANEEWERGRKVMNKEAEKVTTDYPQDAEENEYRYLSPDWLDAIARGLTKGAVKHPGETWRTIPAREHAWRAVRHLIMYLMGDTSDDHLINGSMRVMMAYETAIAEGQRDEWEKLMREAGCS